MSRSNLAVWTARTKFGEKGITKSKYKRHILSVSGK